MYDVSVIIPAYNVEHLIRRAIASVQRQHNVSVEILVIDDASSDATVAVVSELAASDGRIRLIECSSNGGPSEARNRGIQASRGEWIALLDADDMWLDNRLDRLLSVAREVEADIVADNQIFFDEAAQVDVGLGFDPNSERRLLKPEAFLDNDMTGQRLPWGMLKPVFRKSVLNNVLYRTQLRYAEDFLFSLELLLNGAKYVLVPEAYYVYTSPVGKVSGVRSSGSRTQSSDELRLWIPKFLYSTYPISSQGGLDLALRRYISRIHRRLHFQEFTQLRSERKYLKLALKALSHPLEASRYISTGSRFRAVKTA